MRVLVFGHMYTEPIHREKFSYIHKPGDCDVTVVAPTRWKHTLHDFRITPSQDESFTIVPCKISFPGNYFYFFYHSVSKLLKKYSPDIIEIDQEPHSYACFSIIKKVKRILKSAKTVVWTSEDVTESFKFPLSYFERYSLKNIDHIIACNKATEALLGKKGYGGKISVFQFLGVSLKIFRKLDSSALRYRLKLGGKFVVGYVGRLVEGKGLKTLFKAFSLLGGKNRLLIVGKGESERELLHAAKELGIQERVIFTGAVPHEKIPHYMNCMDLLVLPSEGAGAWREKFGYVLPQAMCCEIPIIGSRHGGIPEVIGEAGLIFEPGNASDLLEKMNKLKEDKELRLQLMRLGRERAMKNYTVEIVARKVAKIYRGLCGN